MGWALFVGNLLMGLIALMSQSGVLSAISVIGLPVLLIVWVVIQIFLQNKAWYFVLWAKVTGLTAVKIMDYAHEVKYTVVREQPDGTYVGKLHFHLNLGTIRLLPNGYVDPACDMMFCYVWHPLDADLRTQLQLTHWEYWPNWHAWMEKSHMDMVMYRKSLPDKF